MELILVVVISAGMAENSQNGVSRSLSTLQKYFKYIQVLLVFLPYFFPTTKLGNWGN